MSVCIRNGVTYKRHQWNDALRRLTEVEQYEIVTLCMCCGQEKTVTKRGKATPENDVTSRGMNPTEPTVQSPVHKGDA